MYKLLENTKSYLRLLSKLWFHIEQKKRKGFLMLVVLVLLNSFTEALSIALLFPFLTIFSNPEIVKKNNYFSSILDDLGLYELDKILLFLTILFVIVIVITAILRYVTLWYQSKISFEIGADLGIKAFRNVIYKKYIKQISKNSSDIIALISIRVSGVIFSVLMPVVVIFNSFFLILTIFVTLYIVNPLIAILLLSGFGITYLVIVYFTKSSLSNESLILKNESTRVIKILQESLGGIRDIIIDSSQKVHLSFFEKSVRSLRTSEGRINFIGNSPRYGIEGISLILVAIFSYRLWSSSGGINNTIPTIGTILFGAQRMLPLMQQIYVSYSGIKAGVSSFTEVIDSLEDTNDELNIADQDFSKLSFCESIELKNITYRYSENSPNVLQNINLKIKKGEKIGIIGETGSGKSTLLDIIMGLLEPTEGSIYIDGTLLFDSKIHAWQKNISHVPQAIFLTDSSIKENITLSINDKVTDEKLLHQSIKISQLNDLIDLYGIDSSVGERGIKISGGQRQRIGIARALYKDSELLILDEATSALDEKTESKIIEQLGQLRSNKTILFISHRTNTLKFCDRIVAVKNKNLEVIPVGGK
jgi:ATP-binding cassette subfamily B protein